MTTSRSRTARIGLALAGVVLLVVAVLLPRGWHDALPRNPDVPEPALSGVLLLRAVLALEGLLLLALALAGASYRRLTGRERLVLPDCRGESRLGKRASCWCLVGITVLALVLRSIRLGSDFWLDEIRAILDVREMSVLQVVGSYVRSNVHVLNTLLMKLSVGAFGESEWAARLPAMLFGVLTVPVLYRVGRLTASREVSLGAALLLAVSYHHVLFSQNARGYSPYLFFSLLASVVLVRALRDDRPRDWLLYAAATTLNFASILISGFVFAAHVLVGAGAVLWLRWRGRPAGPLTVRLATVFGLTGLLGFQLYSLVVPQVLAYVRVTYSSPDSGYRLLSTEFLTELVRGLSAGFGPGLLLGVLPFLLLAGVGYLYFLWRQWALAAALTLPVLLTIVLLFVRDLTVSPRFFLLGLPVAILTAVLALDGAARLSVRRFGFRPGRACAGLAVLVLGLAALSISSLRPYYAVPKQPFRAALADVAARRGPGDVVIAIHTARRPCQWYAPAHGLVEGRDLLLADSDRELQALLAEHPGDRVFLLTTFPRALRVVHPELAARIEAGWERVREFPATIGDGEVTVWQPRGP